ncbi:MAG: hypothetical protein PHQ65_16825 [Bacteroidales bacterium]|nr:hypothetical protein [Bacteroidales bacterium]MDD3666932.1 hypothetical protein [Bacteroidales bacterium]
MYAGGHLLTSTLAATKLWSRSELSFRTTTALLLAANTIDFDHLLRYQLDDGTANSLTLHWLHVNSGVVFSLLLGLAYFYRKYRAHALVFTAGLALHFAMDAFAFVLDYSILKLGLVDLSILVILTAVAWKTTLPVSRTRLIAFYSAWWIVVNGIQAGLHFLGGFKPVENGWIYAISPALLGLAALSAWVILKEKEQV